MTDKELLDQIVSLSIRAGAVIREIYAQKFDVEIKGDGSPVTQADRQCEAVILEGLKDIAPLIPVLAEESASEGNIDEIGKTLGDEFFLVDPLDGTREFVNRTGEFTVNIALCRQGYPILGVVYAPELETVYYGLKGTGAWCAKVDGGPLTPSPITVRTPPKTGLIAVASRSHRSPETEALLKNMQVDDFVAAGSSLKFCLVAEGKADIYPRLGRTMEWDTAAGQAVLEAAGGSVVVHPDGERLRYSKAERGYDNPYFLCRGAQA